MQTDSASYNFQDLSLSMQRNKAVMSLANFLLIRRQW